MRRLLAVLVLLTVSCSRAPSYFVQRVADGDTIWVEDGVRIPAEPAREAVRPSAPALPKTEARQGRVKVRLAKIDAPELDQPYGTNAADRLAELILGREVDLEGETRDRYGRLLAIVRWEDIDINLLLVREGWAWYYRGSPAIGPYKDAETAARAAHLGLWQDPAPINPKLWRKSHPSKGGSGYQKRRAKDR